jgi:hypothetical protein
MVFMVTVLWKDGTYKTADKLYEITLLIFPLGYDDGDWKAGTGKFLLPSHDYTSQLSSCQLTSFPLTRKMKSPVLCFFVKEEVGVTTTDNSIQRGLSDLHKVLDCVTTLYQLYVQYYYCSDVGNVIRGYIGLSTLDRNVDYVTTLHQLFML